MSGEIKRFRHHDRRLGRQRGPDPNFLADGVTAPQVKMAANSDKAAKAKTSHGVFPWPLRVAPPAASECRPHCGKLRLDGREWHRDSALDAMPPQMAKK
ncbi:hypothetical protein ACCD06_10440 [Azospirillum sp. CT11-132]|uniref:hypothetical protein n=1 Tax=unclassified Azospirillum TaxID=2630922 RepID=UPI0010AA814B|nr:MULTISPECIES: hypothetical protein [unclassified Azospirillum]QCG98794.1 hypothetical protein E6C67_34815 [Azospirillum sp. TSA2s]